VPATDAPTSLTRCTAALEAADESPDELIVVDRPDGAGPAAARNAGAARATGDVLLFVDSDVEVHRDAVSRIRARLGPDPDLVAVFGSYDAEPEAPGAVSGFRNLLHHHVHQSSAGPVASFWAGLGAVRSDAFAAAGGFDGERYLRPSIEDIELGTRLVAAGARIECDPRVQGTHLKQWDLGEMLRTDFARRGVPWVELLLRAGAPRGELNLGWRHRLSALASVAAAVALARRRPIGAVAGVAALVALNRDFYALIARRRGLLQATAGVGFHALHHLAGVVAVPAGLIAHLADADRG
jgi:GT2 family glycosyltransferase